MVYQGMIVDPSPILISTSSIDGWARISVLVAGDVMPWMYILKCTDDSYYVGSTVNLEKRLYQHQLGKGARYTAKRLPVKLVYAEEFSRIDEAYQREKQVQGWGRAKREALIREDFDALPGLSADQSTRE
jgi:putative endonuclease